MVHGGVESAPCQKGALGSTHDRSAGRDSTLGCLCSHHDGDRVFQRSASGVVGSPWISGRAACDSDCLGALEVTA